MYGAGGVHARRRPGATLSSSGYRGLLGAINNYYVVRGAARTACDGAEKFEERKREVVLYSPAAFSAVAAEGTD